jgi:cytochrome P450
MAVQYPQLAAALLGAWILYSLVKSIISNIQNRRKAQALGCLPPHDVANFFLGIPAYLEVVEAARQYKTIQYGMRLHARGGNTFVQKVLGTRQITTFEPENVKAVLATQFSDFALATRSKVFGPFLGDGIFTLDGSGWSHSRAMLRPQFAREQIADIGMLGEHVDNLFDTMPCDGRPFDIQDLFYRLTLDTATEFLFGESTFCLSPRKAASFGPLAKTSGEKGFAYAFNRCQDDILNRIRAQSFYWLINPPEFRKAVKTVHKVVEYYVDKALAKRNRSEEEKNIDSPNSRYVFLEAVARETQDRKILRDQMLNILVAGRDTTASLLTTSFFYLSRNPAIWDRLRSEILAAFPASENDDKITIGKLREVKYLRYFINEVLRLVPPVPFNHRFATKDTSIPSGGGPDGKSPVFVQKGMKVSYSVAVTHRRKDIWGEDAEQFRPERWYEKSKHGWEFLPFNGGPRICLGRMSFLSLFFRENLIGSLT